MKYGYKILLLALPLYGGVGGGLLSCRSARKIETSETENVDVVVCSKDSMVHDVNLQFDKLEYWLADVCNVCDADSQNSPARVRKVVITNGSLSDKTDRRRLDVADYQVMSETKVMTEQSSAGCGWKINYYLLAIALIVTLFIIIRIRLPCR